MQLAGFLFTALKGLLSLANTISDYMARKQLLDAGTAMEIAKHNEHALKKISRAQRARDAVKSDPDSVPDNDPNNRDGR